MDDSNVTGGHSASSYSNGSRTMTLGRKKKLIQSPSSVEDAPPPPVRSHSRRTESNSLKLASHQRPQAHQSETAAVGGLVSSIASNMEKRSKPPAKLPPTKRAETEPVVPPKPSIKRRPTQKDSTNQATGFSSAKAMLQAKMGGSLVDMRDEVPEAPTKETSSRYTPSNTKQNNDRLVPDERPHPIKPAAKLPPKVVRKYSPQPAAADSCSEVSSSSGSGVFRIKESSSTESLGPSDPPPPPSLPPKMVSTLCPTGNKATRSQSMRGGERIKPLAIEPTDRRNSIDHETDFPATAQSTQTLNVHNTQQQQGNTQAPLLRQPTGSMDFIAMISKSAHFFPTQVRVCKGFASSTCESFSKYDKLQLHFVKHSKVAALKDEYSEEEYTLPLSSSMEFGILYEAEGADVSQYIPRVEDLMALKPLPEVVLATKPYNGGTAEKSVEENEMLFLKKVTKPLIGKGRILEVCNADGMTKKLAAKCEGDFSIHPMHIKMTLSTLMKYSISLPQRVYLLPDPTDATQEYLSDSMTQQPVCLEALRGETSVICTIKGEESVMDISKDLGIQVEIEDMSDQDRQSLADCTLRLYNEFNPTSLSYIIEKSTEREYALQCLLNQQLLPGQEMDGVHIQLPNALSHPTHTLHNTPPPTENAETMSIASSEGLDAQNDYEDVGAVLQRLPEEDNTRLNKKIKDVSKFFKRKKTTTKKQTNDPPYEDTTFSPPPVTIETPAPIQSTPSRDSYEPMSVDTEKVGDYSAVRNMDKHLPTLKKAMEQSSSSPQPESNYVQMNSKIASIMTELNMLKQQVQNLTLTVEGLKGSSGPEQRPVTMATPQPNKGEEEEMSKNREFLRTLSHKQVSRYHKISLFLEPYL